MSKVKKALKTLKSIDRSQFLVTLFLGAIILLSTINLIRDLRTNGIKPFGFVEQAFAQIFPNDNIIAQSLPKAGGVPDSICGNNIDLLQYMLTTGGSPYNLKYCTQNGLGPVPQTLQVEETSVPSGAKGDKAFKLKKGNDYELYTYDNQNIYLIEDTSWDETCPNGLRAYYRVFGDDNKLGGAIPRCWNDGQTQASSQKIMRFYRDSDTPSGSACTTEFENTSPTYQLNIASKTTNGPQVSSLYDNKGTVVLKNTGGAGTGEEKYYSKGYGMTAFYYNNGSNVAFQSSIQTDEVDPTLACAPGEKQINPTNLASPRQDIIDSPDRCVAYNPNTGRPLRSINAGGGTSLETGKGGINQGNLGWNTEIGFAQGNNSLKTDLKMGNILGLFLDPNAQTAIDFVNNANDAGMLPVVRLCYSDSCGFNLNDDSIPEFYKKVSAGVGNNVFVALLGPNEPGTNGEAAAFKVGSATDVPYQLLVDRANYFADELQGYRVKLGGNMYLAPAAFNITNRQNDDVKEYLLSGRGLKLNLFDYLAGNTYNSDGKSAYQIYEESGMRGVVDSSGIKTIITEFGKFTGSNDDLKAAFKQFCDDPNVDGVLFFRSFEDSELSAGQPKPLPVPIADIFDMTSSCAKPRPWIDCNFDSTLYVNNPAKEPISDDGSAISVYTKTQDTKSDPTFQVNCNPGSNNCDYKVVRTMKLRAPIKQYGSNSSFGTETKSFTPVCSEVSSIANDSAYDPMNQFAGQIGDSYPMPWLGSAINCSTELIKYSQEYQHIKDVNFAPTGGSIVTNTKGDIQGDIIRQSVARQYDGTSCYTYVSDGKNYIADEQAIYYKGKLVSKCPVSEIKAIRQYNPFNTPATYTEVKESNTNLKYLNNPDDYITGPEVKISSDTFNVGNFSQMCSQYAERNVNPAIRYVANDTLDCEPLNIDVDGYNCRAFTNYCDDKSIKAGTCTLNKNVSSAVLDDLRNNCFEYTPKPGIDKIYYKDNSFASLPSTMNIPNIYDSLYSMYTRLNTSLLNRNVKIQVNNNLGWDLEGYSNLRDGNSDALGSKTSNYIATDPEKSYPSDFNNDPSATANVKEADIFSNDKNMARGTSSEVTKKTDYYYDWLGYLDIFQEYSTAYQNNSVLEAEQRIPNPFYNTGGPNSDRARILISGLSSQLVSLPLLSCDQIEIGKVYSQADLLANNNVRDSIKTYLLTSNPQLQGDSLNSTIDYWIKLIWPFSQKVNVDMAKATCITDNTDNRYTNKLGVALCNRGYEVEGTSCAKVPPSCVPDIPDAGGTITIKTPTTNITFKKGLQSLIEAIEEVQNIPSGILLGLLERETPGGLADLTGDPFQQTYLEKPGNPVWGPAQFHNIAWREGTNPAYGAFYGSGFSKDNGRASTQACLDKLGITYTNPAYFEKGRNDVLERSFTGYALCAAGAKLKNDSGTGSKSRDDWTFDDVVAAAKAYLGDCSQNGRSYCINYMQTICSLYPNKNKNLCTGITGVDVDSASPFTCTPGSISDPNCSDGNLRLMNPFKDKASEAHISQNWGDNQHSGVDLAIPVETPIYAALGGEVVGIEDHWVKGNTLQSFAGNYVKLQHKVGDKIYWTLYEHMGSVRVKFGDIVSAGTPLGTVGLTGRTTGAHLHFELRHTNCYDGYDEGIDANGNKYTLGDCTEDPMKYVLDAQGFSQCQPTGSGDSGPVITGDFACPIKNASSARILQFSDGCTPSGACGGSHTDANGYNQHQQLPTDIGAPGNSEIIAPVSGTVTEIRTPKDTVDSYDPRGSICDYIRIPDGNPANDYLPNQKVIDNLNLHEDPNHPGHYLTSKGTFIYDATIDDEGDYGYDGGFVVGVKDSTGRLWRMVHLKDVKVKVGETVTVGVTIIGKVYDGVLSGDDAPYSSRTFDGGSCFSVSATHLHFAIIDAASVNNKYYEGNQIDSTPWVKLNCKL